MPLCPSNRHEMAGSRQPTCPAVLQLRLICHRWRHTERHRAAQGICQSTGVLLTTARAQHGKEHILPVGQRFSCSVKLSTCSGAADAVRYCFMMLVDQQPGHQTASASV